MEKKSFGEKLFEASVTTLVCATIGGAIGAIFAGPAGAALGAKIGTALGVGGSAGNNSNPIDPNMFG